MDEYRKDSFQKLKPLCVKVGQIALKYKAKNTSSQELVQTLQNLYHTLQDEQIYLDAKFADYVFFPLSNIFRESKEVPVQALEIAARCLQFLISKGWRSQISPEMSKQLIILLCFLAGGDPKDSKVEDANEELGIAAFDGLAAISKACPDMGLSGEDSLITEGYPTLGYAISTMIDGFTVGPSMKVQAAGIDALQATVARLRDQQILRNLLPGIVSALTKMLAGRPKLKAHPKILITGFQILQNLLCRVLADDHAPHDPDMQSSSANGEIKGWLEATSSQIKMALANILPLRYHDRADVREALANFCTSIISSCRKSMSQSTTMLLETLLVVYTQLELESGAQADLIRLLQADDSLTEVLKAIIRDWTLSLPRTMQANDDTKKQRLIGQIGTGYDLLNRVQSNMDSLSGSLAANLQASVSVVSQQALKSSSLASTESVADVSTGLQLIRTTSRLDSFPPILARSTGTKLAMDGLKDLTLQIQGTLLQKSVQRDRLHTVKAGRGDEQLASLWLCLQTISNELSQVTLTDQFIDSDLVPMTAPVLLDEIYSHSLSVLATSTFDADQSTWRLQALSLEALALQAQFQKEDFRPELVEALYPILERLGSSNAALQEHAMVCLNLVSRACAYPDSAALIVDNADYLVNAISLKLNTFDISPQAPQVLVMMIKLCGAPLIPFLDDLVDSIFSILACYHGYPKLVESLFTVLTAIVEETSKGSVPLIQDSAKDTTTRPKPYKPLTEAEFSEYLANQKKKDPNRPLTPPPPPSLPDSPPASPPPNKSSPPPEATTADDSDDLSKLPPAEPPAPKPSKMNQILTRITSLTPSHLSSPSSTLRTSLLTLLSTSFPLLAPDTDAFLPIAAQLWPYISLRLYSTDAAAFEVLAAAKTMSVLCRCAGDFLKSRTDAEAGALEELHTRCEGRMREEVRANRGRLGGMWWKAWDGVVGLVVSIIVNVGVDEMAGAEDWMFERLTPYLGGVVDESGAGDGEKKKEKRGGKEVVKRERGHEDLMSKERKEELNESLEGLNSDYLWLMLERGRIQRGGKPLEKPPDVDGMSFADLKW